MIEHSFAQGATVSVTTLREAALLAEPALHEPGLRAFAKRVHETLLELADAAESRGRPF